MNNTRKLAFAVFALAALAGCASTGDPKPTGEQATERRTVSKPLPGYGQLGGYRYRRFAASPAQPS